jgi:small-conductance mechanosensitive channel
MLFLQNTPPSSDASSLIQDLINSFQNYLDKAIDYAPLLFLALMVIILGWIIAKVVKWVLHRALKSIKFDDLLEKVGVSRMLAKIKPDLSGAKIIAGLMYWLVMLVFIMASCDMIGVGAVSDAVGAFFSYLPTLLVALVIFILGAYIADLIRNMIYTAANSIGISGAKAISNIVYYVLFIFIAITALNQAGVDTSIITANVTIILGAILLAFALAYGIAARGLVKNLLASYYGKGKFQEGQTIRVGQVEGVITKIDSISLTINTGHSHMVIPSQVLIEENIEILAEPNE